MWGHHAGLLATRIDQTGKRHKKKLDIGYFTKRHFSTILSASATCMVLSTCLQLHYSKKMSVSRSMFNVQTINRIKIYWSLY